jgi:thiol-disulfide isomerase/thioredoxin
MKPALYIIVVVFLTGCFGKKPSFKTGQEGKPLPAVDLLLTDSVSHLNTQKIPVGKPFVIIYFSTECPFCRALTNDIIDDMDELSNIQFYFVSTFPIKDIKAYCNEYHLQNFSNITVAWDHEMFFNKYLNAPGIPVIAIYNKDKKLKKVFIGRVNTNLIKDIALD